MRACTHLFTPPKEPIEVEFTLPEAIIALPCTAISAVYCWKRHWLANNLLAMAFGVGGIEQLSLGNVKVGVILLLGLFVYDIFWVFCTPVRALECIIIILLLC